MNVVNERINQLIQSECKRFLLGLIDDFIQFIFIICYHELFKIIFWCFIHSFMIIHNEFMNAYTNERKEYSCKILKVLSLMISFSLFLLRVFMNLILDSSTYKCTWANDRMNVVNERVNQLIQAKLKRFLLGFINNLIWCFSIFILWISNC